MIVTPKQDIFEPGDSKNPLRIFTKGKDYIVYALYLEKDIPKWYCLLHDEDAGYYPMAHEAIKFKVVDNDTTANWVYSKKRGVFRKEQTYSYPEWANDKTYYQYLVGDDLHPAESKKAANVFQDKVVQYTKDYAIKKFGSVKAAKEHVLKKRYEDELRLHKERGFDRPEKPEVTDKILDSLPLRMADIAD